MIDGIMTSKKWLPLFVLMILGIFILNSCMSVGPDYHRPDIHPPDQWKNQSDIHSVDRNKDELINWWQHLNDPILNDLIQKTFERNLNLKTAFEAIVQARANRGIQNAGQFPAVDANGSAAVKKESGSSSSKQTLKSYNTGLDASWEIDLFGRTKRAIESADAQIKVSQQAYYGTMVSLAAQVAQTYVDLRTLQKRIKVANENLNLQTETYNLTNYRHEAGLSTALDVAEAGYNLETTRAQIPKLHQDLDSAQNELAVLTNAFPGQIDDLFADQKPIPIAPIEIAIDIPATALQRRPDVRQAEQELAAMVAQIGVAKADLYPRLALTGNIGLSAISPDTFFPSPTRSASFGPTLSWHLFDAGAIRRNIDIQNSKAKAALYKYQSVVLSAVKEVENAIKSFAMEQQRRKALTRAVNLAHQAADLALEQYKSGLADFQTVLSAQRSLVSLQDQLAVSEGTLTSNAILLYKTLGGGWHNSHPDSN